jgi:hypothetical protein
MIMTTNFNFQPKQGSVLNGSRVQAIENARIVDYADSPAGTIGTIKSYVGKRKTYIVESGTFKMLDHYMVVWDTSDYRCSSTASVDEFILVS